MTSSPSVTANFYCYDVDLLGNGFGPFNGWNSPTINGCAVAWSVFQSGNTLVNYLPGTPPPMHADYYGFANAWQELNCM